MLAPGFLIRFKVVPSYAVLFNSRNMLAVPKARKNTTSKIDICIRTFSKDSVSLTPNHFNTDSIIHCFK